MAQTPSLANPLIWTTTPGTHLIILVKWNPAIMRLNIRYTYVYLYGLATSWSPQALHHCIKRPPIFRQVSDTSNIIGIGSYAMATVFDFIWITLFDLIWLTVCLTGSNSCFKNGFYSVSPPIWLDSHLTHFFNSSHIIWVLLSQASGSPTLARVSLTWSKIEIMKYSTILRT